MNNEIKINHPEKALSIIVQEWLDSFIEEANLFESANDWREFWRIYKEEPLLTLFSTGIARKDKNRDISILREYPVYFNGSYIGAADLFLNYTKENKHFYIEAKYERARWETGFIDWSEENRVEFFKQVEKQLTFYIEADKDDNSESYAVVLLFYVLDFKKEKDFEEYIAKIKNYNPPDQHFYSILPSKNPKESPYNTFGILEIVGQVKKVQ